MKTRRAIIDKLSGARWHHAELLRATRLIGGAEIENEACAFLASIRTLEWVLEKDREEAKKS